MIEKNDVEVQMIFILNHLECAKKMFDCLGKVFLENWVGIHEIIKTKEMIQESINFANEMYSLIKRT